MVEERLATGNSDGWRHKDLPADPDTWRESLQCLDEDALEAYGSTFAACSLSQQHDLLATIQGSSAASWHHLRPAEIWNLWMRYVCAAFYSHPWAWNEIGFPGPAYPRGYKNLGLDRREPFEQSKRYPDQAQVE